MIFSVTTLPDRPVKLWILGSGTSTGVPVIGCGCSVCLSNDAKNDRTRASIMVDTLRGRRFVIDTGPDFRTQMLRHQVRKLEYVFYTHLHADHCHGFDDLRAFYFHHGSPVPCFLPDRFTTEFRERFAYALEPTSYQGIAPRIELREIKAGSGSVFGLDYELTYVPHGQAITAAYRFGSFLYLTDFKNLPEETIAKWRGAIKTLVASGNNFDRAHKTHSSIPETIELAQELGAERTIITHLSHDVDYSDTSAQLPAGMELAFDGLSLTLP